MGLGWGRGGVGVGERERGFCKGKEFNNLSSETKMLGDQGAAGYCPKSLLLKRGKMVGTICPFGFFPCFL